MRRKMYSVKERSVVCEGGTLTYRLERKPVKNINLRVKSDGSVVVSANRSVSAAHIDNLVREKENFIRKALDRTVPISQEAAPLTKAQKAELLLLFEEVCREVYPLFYKYFLILLSLNGK